MLRPMPSERGAAATDVHSLLVILPTWVGDLVMATPTLRAIRKRFASARITFLLNHNLRELVHGGSWMDECIEWPAVRTRSASDGPGAIADCRLPIADCRERTAAPSSFPGLVRELRTRKFDLAVLLPNSFRAAWIAWCAGARRRVGYARDGRSWLLTDRLDPNPKRQRRVHSRVPTGLNPVAEPSSPDPIRMGTKLPVKLGRYTPTPLVEYYADLAEAIGCDRPGHRLELFTTSDCDASVERRLMNLGILAHRPLVVFSPGAKFGAAKCWPAERFGELASRLIRERDAQVLVACGPGEEPIARKIGEHVTDAETRGKCHILDTPRLSLGELKSLIRRSDLLVCNDAGPRHIAKAFDVPVVTVFGPTHPHWTSTDYPNERVVRIDVDCGPCQQRLCPLGHHQCMTGVSVDAVFQAAASLLPKPAHQHAR